MSRILSNWRRSSSSAAYELLGGNVINPHRDDSYPSTPSSSSSSTFDIRDELNPDDVNAEKQFSRTTTSLLSIRRLRHLTTPSGLTSLFLLLSTIINYIPLLLPSYITALYHRFTGTTYSRSTTTPKKPLSKTAYLDGLRGIAALIVYIFHFNYLFWPILRNGYNSSPTPTTDPSYIFQLPILRVLHSGRASVTIFFIISGYVLTLKTVTSIHRSSTSNAPHDILDGLSGSLFRRPFRLYLPIIVSTAITAILSQYSGRIFIPNLQGGDIPPRKTTWGEQFWYWLSVTEQMVNPFQTVTGRQNLWGNDYNGHLWTIPTEFKGSVLVFVLVLAFARCKRWIHFLGVFGSGYWLAFGMGDFDMALFCVGLLLAEVGVVLPGDDGKGFIGDSVSRKIRHVVTGGLAILGCHLMSYPEARGPSSPGFRRLSTWVPKFYQGNEERIQQFWISVGSILFVVALMYSPVVTCTGTGNKWWWKRSRNRNDEALTQGMESSEGEPLLQKLFTNGFSQYLGHISYSLYLWHGLVNHAVGMRYLHPMSQEWNASEAGMNGLINAGFADEAAAVRSSALTIYSWKWGWVFIFNTFVLFWVSDLFHRGVDVYAVRFTRKISTWALASSSK